MKEVFIYDETTQWRSDKSSLRGGTVWYLNRNLKGNRALGFGLGGSAPMNSCSWWAKILFSMTGEQVCLCFVGLGPQESCTGTEREVKHKSWNMGFAANVKIGYRGQDGICLVLQKTDLTFDLGREGRFWPWPFVMPRSGIAKDAATLLGV